MKQIISGTNPFPYQGLTQSEVISSADRWGQNVFDKQTRGFWLTFKKQLFDPVFLLLMLAVFLYLLLGQVTEAIYMGVAVFIIAAIGFFQDRRSDRALATLSRLTTPKCKVIREGSLCLIPRESLVVGDYMVIEEGGAIAADGRIIQSNDLSVNESLLTGEAVAVWKGTGTDTIKVYAGTTVSSGLAVCEVTAVGSETRMGRIAASLKKIVTEQSPLEKQITRFVRGMSFIGILVFILVWALHFLRSGLWISSLLQALTLAMSILPEEIPVAFSTFMAMGAWRLMQKRILAKDVRTVEALGAATVICLDKTGTITRNEMELKQLYLWPQRELVSSDAFSSEAAKKLLTTGMWASEPVPFDQMEKNLHLLYEKYILVDQRKLFHMEREYPLSGQPPMMTHVFNDNAGHRIISTKGAPERLSVVCGLSHDETQVFNEVVNSLAAKGYRLLAVAEGIEPSGQLPESQDGFDFTLIGLLAFYDPPKPRINMLFKHFYDAGIDIKILTGDNALTAQAIATKAGLKYMSDSVSGDQINAMTDDELVKCVQKTPLFTRMFPEAKLRVIDALKSLGNIVGMTGDGVNDAPALKAANIGIAMGQRGSETAREVASLILLDDDPDKIRLAIAMGRQIHTNLKKAIRYIISIHIPIILVVTLPLLFGWLYPDIFTPVHVVFLELVMGPTCSIVYENEPADRRLMRLPPRMVSADLLTIRELSISIGQGLMITLGALLMYQLGIWLQTDESTTRALVFLTLVSANVALTLANRSVYHSQNTKRIQSNPLMVMIIVLTILFVLIIFTVPAIRRFFVFEVPDWHAMIAAIAMGITSVIWYVPFAGRINKRTGGKEHETQQTAK